MFGVGVEGLFFCYNQEFICNFANGQNVSDK